MSTPVMPSPAPDKVPMKVNAFAVARQGNSQLLPLFPYIGPGAIVPCAAALFSDGQPNQVGYFVHSNTVDEVAVVLGSNGRMRTGDVFVGAKSHGVGGDAGEAFFTVMTITQRQLEEGGQPEALAFQCEKCSAELVKHEFDGGEEHAQVTLLSPLPTIAGSFEAAMKLNSSEAARTCSACGHVSPLFPLHFWGWGHYMHNTKITVDARRALEEVAH